MIDQTAANPGTTDAERIAYVKNVVLEAGAEPDRRSLRPALPEERAMFKTLPRIGAVIAGLTLLTPAQAINFEYGGAINPLDAVLALQPGFNLNELAVPTGMVLLAGDVIDNLSFEALYQYDWDTTKAQPSGSFFSSADPVGIDQYSPVLALGQFPEDPDGRFVPGNPFKLFTSSKRTSLVKENGNPARDGGQYGARLN